MASVFKRCRTAPIPKNATISEHVRPIPKSATIADGLVTWVDRSGMTLGGILTKDAKQVLVREAFWEETVEGGGMRAWVGTIGRRASAT